MEQMSMLATLWLAAKRIFAMLAAAYIGYVTWELSVDMDVYRLRILLGVMTAAAFWYLLERFIEESR